MAVPPKPDPLVLVAVDNTGEPYICASPVKYVRLYPATPLKEPRRMLMSEYRKMRNEWKEGR